MKETVLTAAGKSHTILILYFLLELKSNNFLWKEKKKGPKVNFIYVHVLILGGGMSWFPHILDLHNIWRKEVYRIVENRSNYQNQTDDMFDLLDEINQIVSDISEKDWLYQWSNLSIDQFYSLITLISQQIIADASKSHPLFLRIMRILFSSPNNCKLMQNISP